MERKRSIDFFPSSPFRWERAGACPGPDPGVRAQAAVYADTHESSAYVILLSILTVGALVVSLVVGSGKTVLAASASGNDPGAGTFAANCATCHAQNGSGDTTVGKSVKNTGSAVVGCSEPIGCATRRDHRPRQRCDAAF
jgi:hypothetical protein